MALGVALASAPLGCGDCGAAKETARTAAPTASSERAASVPSLDVPRLPRGAAIVIDGALDEPAWAAAGRTGPFVAPGSGLAAPELPVGGSARLLWDDAHLYVAVEVRDATIRGGFPPDAVDPHLWERDTIEIMLDPGGDNRDYVEIQVSPQNLVFDSRFDDYNLPRGGPAGPFGHQDWSAELESAVRLRGSIDDDGDEDDGYVVELRVPFAALPFGAPEGGGEWRANLYAMQDNGGVAWSPILGQGNFHRASRFGRVRFSPAADE